MQALQQNALRSTQLSAKDREAAVAAADATARQVQEIREWLADDIAHRFGVPCSSDAIVPGTHRHRRFLLHRQDRCMVSVNGALIQATVKSSRKNRSASYSVNGVSIYTPKDLERVTN